MYFGPAKSQKCKFLVVFAYNIQVVTKGSKL